MPDYVLKNKKTGGQYVLSTPNGAGDDYLKEAAAPLLESGWVLDDQTDPAAVAPQIQQPPPLKPQPPTMLEPTKEIS